VAVCVMKLKRQLLVQRRGAVLALTAIARDVGTDLQEKLLSFWDAMFGPITAVSRKFFVQNCVTKKLLIECMYLITYKLSIGD